MSLKTPFILLQFPAVFVALAGAATILAIASASSPMFLSSVGNATLNRELASFSQRAAGLSVAAFGRVDRDTFAASDRALRRSASRMDELGPPRVTVFTPSTAIGVRSQRNETFIRLLFRTGGLSHIQRLSRGVGRGVWIADTSAEELGVRPGDHIEIRRGGLEVAVRVAGIYRDLASRPISAYWRPMSFEIISPIPDQPPPPPFLIADRKLFFDIKERVRGETPGLSAPLKDATFRWEFPLAVSRMTLRQARFVSSEFLRFKDQANDPLSETGKPLSRLNTFGAPEVDSLIPGIVDRSEETVAAIEGSVRLISVAGRLVALVVIAAAGLFSFHRRRVEVRLLSAQGIRPATQGVKAAFETILPLALAGVAGWWIALWSVKALGPTPLISSGVPAEAAGEIAWTMVVAIVLLGSVSGLAARREAHIGWERGFQVLAKTPWEALVLALAAASLYELVNRGSPIVETAGAAPRVDVLLLAFPILFIAGLAGLAARVLGRLLRHLKRIADRAPAPLYLAARRFGAAPFMALALVGSAALALGILVYSGLVVSVTDATADAKAQVRAGSDVAATIRVSEDWAPDELPFPATRVERTDADLFPGDIPAEVLAIDLDTFAAAAYFNGSFADSSLGNLLKRLDDEGARIPVLVAGGDVARDATLQRGRDQLPVRVIESTRAWPGMNSNSLLVVVDREALEPALAAVGATLSDPLTTTELWARGEPDFVLDALNERDIVVEGVRTAQEVRTMPVLASLSWTFGFMQALGVLAGLIALVGMILYLQARQQAREVSYALARRMGLSRRAHLLAVALELTGMLVISFAVGAGLALMAGRLISSRLDPLPELPPPPLFTLPALFMWVVPLVLIALAGIAAWWLQRSADRMNVAQVMRVAD